MGRLPSKLHGWGNARGASSILRRNLDLRLKPLTWAAISIFADARTTKWMCNWLSTLSGLNPSSLSSLHFMPERSAHRCLHASRRPRMAPDFTLRLTRHSQGSCRNPSDRQLYLHREMTARIGKQRM